MQFLVGIWLTKAGIERDFSVSEAPCAPHNVRMLVASFGSRGGMSRQ